MSDSLLETMNQRPSERENQYTMTIPFICDGSGRRLIQAGDYDGPDVLYIREQPDALFGPKRKRRRKALRAAKFGGSAPDGEP